MGRVVRAFSLLLICLLGLVSPGDALERKRLDEARPLTESELVALLRTSTDGRPGVSDPRVEAGDFVVSVGKREMRFGLASLTRQLNAEPDGRSRQKAFDSLLLRLDRFAAGGDPAKPSQAEVARFRDALLPVLKNRAYIAEFAALARKQGVPDGKLLHLPLAGDVIVVPVEDRPRISRFLSVGEGERFGLSDKDIFAAALKNLKRRVKNLEITDFGGVQALSFDTDYNVSMLLMPEVWRSVPNLPSNLVVALPARDVLAFGDGSDPRAVEALRAVAKMPDGGYPVTKLLLKRAADGWQVLE